MPTANYELDQSFHIQFVWRMPEGGYLRAVFAARVLDFDWGGEKYIVRLERMMAKREETVTGSAVSADALNEARWDLVRRVVGKKISVAFEADDGRPLPLRFETLTGEHRFFDKLSDE